MSRSWIVIAVAAGLAAGLSAQDAPTLRRAPGSDSDVPRPTLKKSDTTSAGESDAAAIPAGQAAVPEEEDKSVVKKEYSFNPVQSKKDVSVGDFYFKKGDYKAAAGRFTEATKWNAGNAEAWLRLGETEEKQGDKKSARAAYEQYLELAADAKNAGEVKQRLEKLKK